MIYFRPYLTLPATTDINPHVAKTWMLNQEHRMKKRTGKIMLTDRYSREEEEMANNLQKMGRHKVSQILQNIQISVLILLVV